jgi:hypothetical protein
MLGLGNLKESPLSMGNPSNSSEGTDSDSGLCGRATPGDPGKELPTGEGREGDCEVDVDERFEECDVDDFDFDLDDFVFLVGPLGSETESGWVERGKGTLCGGGWEVI